MLRAGKSQKAPVVSGRNFWKHDHDGLQPVLMLEHHGCQHVMDVQGGSVFSLSTFVCLQEVQQCIWCTTEKESGYGFFLENALVEM